MFSTAAPILKTLTKDPETERVRSIDPDEHVESIWDGLDKNARAWSWSPQSGFDKEGFDDSYKYTEADEVEDAILFPLENTGLLPNDLYHHTPNAMEMFEKEPLDLRRFAADLDTDDEPETSEGEYIGEADDDGDSDWSTDVSDEEGDFVMNSELCPGESEDADKAIYILSEQFQSITMMEPDYFLPILRNPNSKRAQKLPKSIRSKPDELMWACRFAMRSQQEYDTTPSGMEADFFRHIDRQKSKGRCLNVMNCAAVPKLTYAVFKQSFHLGDTEPGALSRYVEHKFMVDAMDEFIMSRSVNPAPFELCKFMHMADMFFEERRIVDDAFRAYAAIAVFFEGDAFLASEYGEPWRGTKLLNQEERAKHLPDRRTHLSNKTMPKEFWKDWEELLKANRRRPGDVVNDIYPMEWRKALRSVIIKRKHISLVSSLLGEQIIWLSESHKGHRPLNC
jgi:hypothetical protein